MSTISATQHRLPCVNGSVCGEAAHCPPEEPTAADLREQIAREVEAAEEGWAAAGRLSKSARLAFEASARVVREGLYPTPETGDAR